MEAQQREIADRVRQLQREHGLTNEQLAYKAGLSVKTVSRVLNAHHEPRADTIRGLAKAFDVPESAIRGLAPDPFRRNGDDSEMRELLTQLLEGQEDQDARLGAIAAAVAAVAENLASLRRDLLEPPPGD